MSSAASATATRVTSTGTTTAAHPRPAVARWVTLTTARAATKTPTSRARYPFTDIRTSSSRLGPFPTWWYRVPRARLSRRPPLTPAGWAAWMSTVDTWDPARYERFAAERAAPFHDLLSLVGPVPGGRVVDLGCGSGELTAQLHRRLEAAETLGLDSSPAMLERAAGLAGDGLRFAQGDIASFDEGGWDVVFSNAALHW